MPNWSIAWRREQSRKIGERYVQRCMPLPLLPTGVHPARVFDQALVTGFDELAQAALIKLACTLERHQYQNYAERFRETIAQPLLASEIV